MTDCYSAKEWVIMLERSIDRENSKPEPSQVVLWNLQAKRSSALQAFKEAIQREAKNAAYSSRWNENVADLAALCGF